MKHIFGKLDANRKEKMYQQEAAKLEFATQLHARMTEKDVNRAALAAMIEHSPAYVTKVLRGDNNPTIETMVELVYSLGGKLHFQIADQDQRVRWRGIVDGGSRGMGIDAIAWPSPSSEGAKSKYVPVVDPETENDHALVA